MATGMLDVVVPHKYIHKASGEERTGWTKVGVAFPRKGKGGYSAKLNFPVGSLEFVLMEPKPREERAQTDLPVGEADFPPAEETLDDNVNP